MLLDGGGLAGARQTRIRTCPTLGLDVRKHLVGSTLRLPYRVILIRLSCAGDARAAAVTDANSLPRHDARAIG